MLIVQVKSRLIRMSVVICYKQGSLNACALKLTRCMPAASALASFLLFDRAQSERVNGTSRSETNEYPCTVQIGNNPAKQHCCWDQST